MDARRTWRLTGVYAVCHFVVDLASVATVLGPVRETFGAGAAWGPIASTAAAIMAYNMLAFALQLPIGALLDQIGGDGRRASIASFVLTAIGVVLGLAHIGAAAVASVAFVAVGNALFHDAGGIRVLGESLESFAPPGAFIATGAFGVFLGSQASAITAATAAAILLAALLGCSLLVWHETDTQTNEPQVKTVAHVTPAAIALLCATVALRSYAGMVMAFPWKASSLALAVIAVVAIALGKAAGGFVADRAGVVAASVISLGGAALVFPFSWTSVVAGVIATLLFNFTMPITLVMLARLFPGEPGLAFGTASFSLAIGALPALMGFSLAGPWQLCALSAVSLVTLVVGLRLAGEGR